MDRAASGGGRAVTALLALTALAALAAATTLGVNADNERLLDEALPFQQTARAFESRFPPLTNALLLVVDADTATRAAGTADALASRLARERELFEDVYVPTHDPFFERHGLLYRSPEELEIFGEQLARLQPFLASLARDPTLATLAELVERGLEHLDPGAEAQAEWARVLEGMQRAAVSVDAGSGVVTTWEDLLLEGSAFDPRLRTVVIAEPVLNFDRVLSAGLAIEHVREVIRELGIDGEGGVRVRITGYPALNDEEMRSLATDVGVSGLLSLALVVLVLRLALASGRLAAAAGATLLVGLMWTAAFAGLAVGDLNIVSVTFAVLFIGLGVDFALHLGLHYAAARQRGGDHAMALGSAAREVGTPLVLCAASTAIGFFAFMPTHYRGMAELGLIAGTGMFIILFLTAAFFPALLSSWLRPASVAPARPAGALRALLMRLGEQQPGAVATVFAVLLSGSVVASLGMRFDANVVALRDPGTESVQAFDDLVADSSATPWHADLLADDLADARRRAARLAELPEVERAVTLADYVPQDQEEKLEILADAAFVLGAPLRVESRRAAAPVADQVAALRALSQALASAGEAAPRSELAEAARLLREAVDGVLARVDRSPRPQAELARFEQALLGNFPDRLARLETALATPPIALGDLPARLTRRMRAPDGHARVQIFPAEDLSDTAALEAFVAAVLAVEPQATGLPVGVVQFGREVAGSLAEALGLAALLIASLLLARWRRPLAVLLTLAPLGVAAACTVGTMAVLGLSFNFANVIVLPLLLGVGVDSGIHLVARARQLGAEETGLAAGATARAVFWSAITTIASFGSLALSGHRGIASLGMVLVIGMLWTLAANLLLLPALLTLTTRGRSLGN